MKKWLLLLFLAPAFSFAGELNWLTDLDQAKAVAKKENKTILINFSGSDWCGWCKRLDREVFSKEAFSEFAEKNLVLVMLDFPKYKKQSEEVRVSNEKLAQKYRVEGFPTILLVDADEKLLLTTGYRAGGPESYVKHLKAKIENPSS